MSDEWDFYLCQVDSKPASIFCDLGIRDHVPLSELHDLTWLRLHMQQPRPDGLSSQEEFPRLVEIEEALEDAIAMSPSPVQYVGRNTSDGCRDFYFYSTNHQQAESSLSLAMVRFGQYEFETGSRPDPEWMVYLSFLYPSPRAWQTISNQRVLHVLKEHGDKHEIERDVSHWLYFRCAEDWKKCVDGISSKGYRVVDTTNDASGEMAFGVTIARTHAVDFETINSVTLELFDLANEHRG
jgi:hypothetical protein